MDELPRWAKRKPDARGLLIPTALRATLAKALGPFERELGIKSRVPLYATRSPAGWGLTRQLAVGDDDGRDVAKSIDILAKHELPLTALNLWYPPPSSDAMGTASGAARLLKVALAASAVDRLHRLHVLLHQVRIDAKIANVLATAIGRMPRLEGLDLRAAGGTAIGKIVAATGTLRSLALVQVGANGAAVRSLARAKSLASLERLELSDQFDDAALAALLAAPFAPGLRSLKLASGKRSELPGIDALAGVVELTVHKVGAKGMTALANASFVPNLRELHITGATITNAIGTSLAKRGLLALEVLHVKYSEATATALEPIVRAAPKLRLIEVPAALSVPRSWVKRGREIL